MIVLLVDSGQTLWRGAVRQGTPLCLQPGTPDTLGAWPPAPHPAPCSEARWSLCVLHPAPAPGGMC